MTEPRSSDTPSIFSLGLALFFVGVILFFALVRGEAALAVPAGAVLLLMYGGRLWSRIGLSRLTVVPDTDRDRLFPGETFRFQAVVENRKLLPVRVRIELDASREVLSGGDPLRGETGLYPYEKASKSWALTALRRGVYRIGPARISAGDLLGLHLRSKTVPFSREIVVFPRLPRLRDLDVPFQEYFGIHASRGAVEDPAWYAGTRDYAGNRPAKNIHWKASARLGVLQEKLFEPTSHRKVFFVLDAEGFSDGRGQGNGPENDGAPAVLPGPEDMELLIEVLASAARDLMETGASFGFATNAALAGGRPPLLPLGRGPEHLGCLLEMLARVERRPGEALAPLVRETARGGVGIVYFGASGDGDNLALLDARTARRLRMLFVLARGPAEVAGAGGAEADGAGSGGEGESGAGGHVFILRDRPAYVAKSLLDE